MHAVPSIRCFSAPLLVGSAIIFPTAVRYVCRCHIFWLATLLFFALSHHHFASI
ncbi:hypothetical protein C8J56DRAFT_939742 [Mycena floridula]|nr:hypothetical protein C8J56DRAFT_945756 [Mycena floridula]KAJ7588626.1 hypothetical protein C8J56DRAFT_939742 [Mycena floridula]